MSKVAGGKNRHWIFYPQTRRSWKGPDPEVLAFATEQNRILVTHDHQTMPHHFGEFLMSGRSSPGVFLVSQYAPVGVVIDELVLIWAASNADEWKNRIVNIPQA